MNLLKSLCDQAKQNQEEDDLIDQLKFEIAESANEVDISLFSYINEGYTEIEDENLIEGKWLIPNRHLNEMFGNKKKAIERESNAREYARNNGKSARYQQNIDAEVRGGKSNAGRLEQLNEEFGVAKFDSNGKLPKRPDGMTPADYQIWVQMLVAQMEKKTTDNGPSIGPSRGDIVRSNGKSYIIVNDEAAPMVATARDKDGNILKIKWSDLPKPSEIEGKTVYQT